MLFASLFSIFGVSEEPPHKKSEALMAKIVNTSIKQLSKRYNLVPMGTGGGNADNKSKMESVSFALNNNMTIQEVRVLIVEIVELMLYNINSNSQITPYLYDNPFTYKNLQIRIFIYNRDGSNVYHPNLGVVRLSKGAVYFFTYEPGTNFDYASEIQEPYEEAYSIATGREYSQSH